MLVSRSGLKRGLLTNRELPQVNDESRTAQRISRLLQRQDVGSAHDDVAIPIAAS
jgi:hypothetical protein